MNNIIKIVCETETLQACKFKEIFRNSFEVDSSLEYDYRAIVRGLKALFPDKKLFIHISVI